MHSSTPTEPLDRLRRLVALRAAGLPEPPAEAAWLTSVLAAALEGEDLRELFGLRASPGKRSPVRRAALRERNDLVRQLFSLGPEAGQVVRGDVVVAWVDDPATAPPAARPLVRRLRQLPVRFPTDGRTIARIAMAGADELPP